MLQCGLLGKTLAHSSSGELHALFGLYDYRLFEVEETAVSSFLQARTFDGLNVTIPYKKTVIPYLDTLTETAARLGSVNTIVKQKDGKLLGHNTDFGGFLYMVKKSGFCLSNKKVLVLGSGGAAASVCAVLEDLKANFTIISRRGENTYDTLSNHRDAEYIVNTTPLGMYPKNGVSPLSLADFPALRGVMDIVYNPFKTALLLEAERLSIPYIGGLSMLVAQGKESAEWFTGESLPDAEIERIFGILSAKRRNLVLLGMPGAGKTTLGKLLAGKMNRKFVDTDAEIEARAGISIPEIFEKLGEEAFRRMETEVLEAFGKEQGLVLSTGGGCVTRAENLPLLRQNGVLVWIKRDTNALPTNGRPLSAGADLSALYAARKPLYEKYADLETENNDTPERVAERIQALYENFSD